MLSSPASARDPKDGEGTSFAVVFVLLVLLVGSGQSQQAAQTGDLSGVVRDSGGRAIAGASVQLNAKDGAPATAKTDSRGRYMFSGLHAGVYTLTAGMSGYGDASISSILIEPNEAKRVDLTLASMATQAPAFDDQPKFTVSGVTDTTSLGGHGSDTVVRTRESLAKETAGLSKTPPFPEGSSATETSLREAVEREPGSFEANHRLGAALVKDGKAREAIAYLQRAADLKPDDFENSYSLARANADAGEHERARQQARALLAHHSISSNDKAALHHLLADVEERLGSSLEAVREYERAAELNPSEPYLFDWGAELLLHHAPEPASEVFAKGNKLFPGSARVLIGLGASWFARGAYDQAVERMCAASDLDPNNPAPYLFLGRIDQAGSERSDAVLERLRRFVALHPERAEANYYYAASLWKRRKNPADAASTAQVESLLNTAIHLDPKFAAAYLQLGILHAEQLEFPRAIADYQHAIQADPQLEEAHYRLAQAFRQSGDAEKAKAEIEIYDRMTKESAQQAERERHESRQFVYTLRDQPPAQQP
jgi:tetratricopeptide (TPR) repeat protein